MLNQFRACDCRDNGHSRASADAEARDAQMLGVGSCMVAPRFSQSSLFAGENQSLRGEVTTQLHRRHQLSSAEQPEKVEHRTRTQKHRGFKKPSVAWSQDRKTPHYRALGYKYHQRSVHRMRTASRLPHTTSSDRPHPVHGSETRI